MRERAKKIAEKITRDSFPLLEGKRVFIIVTWFRFYALSVWIPPCLRFIVISNRTKNFNDDEMTGLIAHELSHQERYLSMGTIKYILFAIRFVFSRKVQAFEEKATDRLTIEKGYGRYIYEISKLSKADPNHKKINPNYLTPEEIKGYAEELGKW